MALPGSGTDKFSVVILGTTTRELRRSRGSECYSSTSSPSLFRHSSPLPLFLPHLACALTDTLSSPYCHPLDKLAKTMSFLARRATRAAIPRTLSRRTAAVRVASTPFLLRNQLNPVLKTRQFSAVSSSMMSAPASIVKQNVRPEPDQVLQDIADYVHSYEITSPLAVSVFAPLIDS